MALFIWSVDTVVCVAPLARTDELVSGLATTLDIIDISDIIYSFDHAKSSSILH